MGAGFQAVCGLNRAANNEETPCLKNCHHFLRKVDADSFPKAAAREGASENASHEHGGSQQIVRSPQLFTQHEGGERASNPGKEVSVLSSALPPSWKHIGSQALGKLDASHAPPFDSVPQTSPFSSVSCRT